MNMHTPAPQPQAEWSKAEQKERFNLNFDVLMSIAVGIAAVSGLIVLVAFAASTIPQLWHSALDLARQAELMMPHPRL